MHAPAQAAYRAEDIRAVEQRADAAHGLSGGELMERAGRAAFSEMRTRWPGVRHVAVAVGPGNNGGDGHVVAKLAAAHGLMVEIIDVARGARRTEIDPAVELIVDALFGIGFARPPDGAYAELIDAINAHPAPVLALDLPSGLHADDGRAPGAVVRADLTVSFLAYKRGQFTGAGPAECGTTVVADLGVPAAAYDGLVPVATLIPDGLAARSLGARARDAHKGDFGHVLVVGGRAGLAGAARLAGEAALRCGAGLVSVAVAPGAATTVGAGRPELMVHECADAGVLAPLIERASVIAVGPGLGTDPWAQDMLRAVMHAARPLVVDADALNLLAAGLTTRDDWILTPHPGEAGRMLRTSAKAVQSDRYAAVAALTTATGGVCVLKGACTLVAAPSRTPRVCTAGNPGMASGGMGDLLTGVIAALRAQGLEPWQAASAGVGLHADAGDVAAAEFGPRGLIAGDLLTALQRSVNEW